MKNIAILLLILAASCHEKPFDPMNNPNDHSDEPNIMVGYEWAGAKGSKYRLLNTLKFPTKGTVYYFDISLKDTIPIELNADYLTVVKFEMETEEVSDTVVFVTKGDGKGVLVQQLQNIFFFGEYPYKKGIYSAHGFYESKGQVEHIIHKRQALINKGKQLHLEEKMWNQLTESNNILQYYSSWQN